MAQSTQDKAAEAEQRRMRPALKAAEEHGGTVVRWSTALDNHQPPRDYATGYGVCYIHRVTNEPGFMFWPGNQLRDVERSILIIDDGVVATPYYCAGWNQHVLFQPFPTNPHDGRIRPDTGQPIDHSGWVLGPRRAYHLKIVKVPAGVIT